MITQLIYISTAAHALSRAELPAILDVSQRNNRRADVSGLLLYDGIRFMQALEGNSDAVEATFARIQNDPRHRSAVVLGRRLAAERDFGEWAMAYEENITAPGAQTLIERVETLVAGVENKNLRELFRSFARVERYAA